MVRRSVLLIALMALLCVLLWSGLCAGASPYGDLDAWLKQAGLGPYAPEKEDWDQSEAARGNLSLSICQPAESTSS